MCITMRFVLVEYHTQHGGRPYTRTSGLMPKWKEHSLMDSSFLWCSVGHLRSVMSRGKTWSSDQGRCQSSHNTVITEFYSQVGSGKHQQKHELFTFSWGILILQRALACTVKCTGSPIPWGFLWFAFSIYCCILNILLIHVSRKKTFCWEILFLCPQRGQRSGSLTELDVI